MTNYDLALANLEDAQSRVENNAADASIQNALLFAQLRATLAVIDEIRAYNAARAEESRRRAETGLAGTRDTRGAL